MSIAETSSPAAAKRRFRLVAVLAAALAIPALGLILYHYPPGEFGFYPPCLLHALTGLHCPGCGGTRCLHALLHGNLAQAVAYNGLTIVLIPALAVYGVRKTYSVKTGKPMRRLFPPWSVYLMLSLIIAFWIMRNINIYPFSLLAPHEL